MNSDNIKTVIVYDPIRGGFISLNFIENLIPPVKKIKDISTFLNNIRYNKKKDFIKPEDKILAKISNDVYNKPNERKIKGYIKSLSNDEIGVYIIDDNIIIGIRGTTNKDDIKTDALLASGLLKNSNRYKRNKKKVSNIINNLKKEGFKNYNLIFTGHSLGGALAKLIAVDYKKSEVVVFNPGCGINRSYGKKATLYASKGDPVSATCMLSGKDDIRIIKSKGESILDRHAMGNFTNGGNIIKYKNNIKIL